MKKRWIAGIAAICVLALSGTAFAQGDGGTQQPSSPAQAASAVLTVDNQNLYEGMDKPYSSGYLPTVENGAAKIILPLVCPQELQNGSINTTVNLGDASTSPFVFQNYDMTIPLAEHTVNNGASKVQAYLAELTLPLAEGRLNGRYPVVVSAKGQVKGGSAFTQDFTLYVTVTDGAAPGAQQGGDVPAPGGDMGGVPDAGAQDPGTPDGGSGAGGGTEEPRPQPKVMISGYSVSPSPVLAGQEFDLSVTLQNTNDSQPIRNMKVTVGGETADVVPMGETNSFYFKKVAKKETVTINTKMMVQQTVEPKPQKLLLHIEYEGDKATAYTADESVVIQVKQPMRVEYDEPEIPKEVNAGDTLSLALNVMNMGKGTVYNVRAELAAPGLSPEGSVFLGNLESGTSKKGDLYVFVATLDADGGGKQDGKYGATGGKITLSYEDEFGEISTQEINFTTNINPPVINAPQEEEEEKEPPKTQSQWWISAIILAGVIAAILAILYYRKRAKRKAEDDENG